ncbi:putative zinc-finger protein C4F10.19c [Colletotrichum chlorophyti]|uniref:Putative zinc-finger protein C4F10.19c n=1 Tax=Colletotrichum chlorophyti TaxID=708187 RepID=A0A1Q8S1K1_9PEZI|nr:putative zinc-finger protein C4F10.19c [Colletotrichum chlorophyti]
MSLPSEQTPNPPQPPPRSPKRAQEEDDNNRDPSEPASKRSRAASPSDDDEGTKETTAAMASATLETATAAQHANGAAPAEEPDETKTPAAPRTKMCGVCNEKEGKYKCTRCALPFCSVPCNKLHRENHPPDPEPTSKTPEPPAAPQPVAGARDPKNPFIALDDSDQLRYLFRRYPGLQTRLLDIIAATEPPPDAQGAGGSLNDMMRARATAAANPKKEQWTHDVGIRNGKEALRKARNEDGEVGEGVREYIELINHLVSQASADAEAEEVIRRRAAEKDAELIRRLMAEERG